MTPDEVRTTAKLSRELVGSLVCLKQILDGQLKQGDSIDQVADMAPEVIAIFTRLRDRAGISPGAEEWTKAEAGAYMVEACKWFIEQVETL